MRADRVLITLIAIVLIAAAVVTAVKMKGIDDRSATAPGEPVGVAGEGNASLLVVGVQGLEPAVMDRLIAEGRLPNLAALTSGGSVATFSNLGRNTDPRIGWTSIVTGMLPENQGVGGKRMSHRGEMVDAPLAPHARTVGTLWTFASDAGLRCGVVGWPGTWPVEELNGVMVGPHTTYVLEREHSGAPQDGVSPTSENARIDRLMTDGSSLTRRDFARFVKTDSRLGLEALVGQNYEALVTAQSGDVSAVNVAAALADDPGADCLFVFLPGVDVVSQRFWHYMETEAIEKLDVGVDERRLLEGQIEALGGTVDRYYEFTDELIGRLLAMTRSDATVAIVAVHGYGGIPFDAAGLPKIGVHMHSEEGVLILAGPGVSAAGARASGRLSGRLIDVAPTIAAAAGIEMQGSPDGSVLEEMLAN